jgi:cell wall hydrolase
MTDRDAIALTLYGEARGEGTRGRIAVACVLRNRLRSGKWGGTYEGVCLARKQFSCWNATDPNSRRLLDELKRVQAGDPIDRTLRECYALADVLLNEDVIRQVGQAMHYYADSIAPPKWAATGELVASVGHHKFFERVA